MFEVKTNNSNTIRTGGVNDQSSCLTKTPTRKCDFFCLLYTVKGEVKGTHRPSEVMSEVVYYESIKRELQIRSIYECRMKD